MTAETSEKTPSHWKRHVFLLLFFFIILAVNALLFAAVLTQPLQYLETKMGLTGALVGVVTLAILLALVLPAVIAMRVFSTSGVLVCLTATQVAFLLGALVLKPELVRQNLAITPGKILGEQHLAVRALENVASATEQSPTSIRGSINSPIQEVRILGAELEPGQHRTRIWESDESISVPITLRPGHDKTKVKATLSLINGNYEDSQIGEATSENQDDLPQTEVSFTRPTEGWKLGKYHLSFSMGEQEELKTNLEIVDLQHRKVGEVVKLLSGDEAQETLEVDGCWLVDLKPGVHFDTGVATVKRDGKFLGDAFLRKFGRDAYFRPLGTFVPLPSDDVYYRESGPKHCDIEGETHHAEGSHGSKRAPERVGSSVVFRKDAHFSLYLFAKAIEEHEPAQIYSIRTLPYTVIGGEQLQAQTPYPRAHILFRWSEDAGLTDLQAYWVTEKGAVDPGSARYPIDTSDVQQVSVEEGRLKMKLKRLSEPYWDIQLETDVWEVDDFIELGP